MTRILKIVNSLPGRFHYVLPAIFLIFITLLAYFPAIRHGAFVWDDQENITDSPIMLSAAGLGDIWGKVGMDAGGTMQYYPLTYTSFWLEYRLWKLNPLGYHLNNVLLHALNAVLVWITLCRLGIPGALLAAVIFAVHPVHVESVAWITERKNVLSGLFYFLSLLSFIRFFGLTRPQDSGKHTTDPGRRKDYYAGLTFFLCALLSKSATVTLPPTILLLIWWRTGRIGFRNVLFTLPIFLMAIPSGLITTFVERFPGGAMGTEWTMSPLEHLLLAGRILCFYAGKLFWPHPLTFIYPRWNIDQTVWWQYLFPLGVFVAFAALWMFRRLIGRGALAAALFFAGTLSTVLGFINVYFMRFSYVADHFQYLASLGLITLFAAGATLSYRALRLRGTAHRAMILIFIAIIVATLGYLTWRQSGIYRSAGILWMDTLRKNPDCWLAHNNLGVFLADQGKELEAIAHFRETLRLKSDYPEGLNNLGISLAGLGQRREAIAHYRKALSLKPDYSQAHYNMGVSLAALGRTAEAISRYRAAIYINPDYFEAYNNLGVALTALGRWEDGVACYRTVLKIHPDYPATELNLGLALAALGRTEEAISHYRKVADIPESRNNWGLALAALGRTDEAVAQYREALRLRPDYPQASTNLGLALAKLGRTNDAEFQYRAVLHSHPNDPEAHNNLGLLLTALGRTEEAAAHYREVLRITPGNIGARNNLCLSLASLGRTKEAASEYRKLLQIQPDFNTVYYDLGLVLAAQRISTSPAINIR